MPSFKINRVIDFNLFWIFLAIIGGAIWIWLTKAPLESVSYSTIPVPYRGFQAPDFELQDSSGKTVRLSDLRGKPVLLNYWAAWCAPCRAEMPAMEAAYQRYKNQGFEILAVNTTYQDSRKDAEAFIEELGLDFTVLFDEDSRASELYQLQALPSSFFIDDQGIIQDVVLGGPMSEALLDIRIRSILKSEK